MKCECPPNANKTQTKTHDEYDTAHARANDTTPQEPLDAPPPSAPPTSSPHLTEAHLTDTLNRALSPAVLRVTDESDGCGAKFALLVVSDAFDNKPLLERQRAVFDALAAEMPRIHALTMKTWTRAQYDKKKQAGAV